MKNTLTLSLWIVVALLSAWATTAPADTTMVWQVISNGGTDASGDDYVLLGTVNQTAIGRSFWDTLCLQTGVWPIVNPSCQCCFGMRGNVDADPNDVIDISDHVYLTEFMFFDGPPPPCMEEADVDGSGGDADIGDLVYLTEYMFDTPPGPAPVSCP